jgi:hypothetical protein
VVERRQAAEQLPTPTMLLLVGKGRAFVGLPAMEL